KTCLCLYPYRRQGGSQQMPARAFRRDLRLVYFAPFLAMAILAAVVLWRVNAQVSSAVWVEHSYEVIRKTRRAQDDLLRMTVAVRSYWLSDDRRYLISLQEWDQDLDANLATMSALVSDNPAQGQRALEASILKGKWVGAVQTLMAQRNAGQTFT